jgi:hypothetical protein
MVQSSQDSPVNTIGTETTPYGVLSFPFTVDDKGCTVRFVDEQRYFHIAFTLPHYNALYSLLLACFMNRTNVRLEYIALLPTPAPEIPTFTVLSATASPAGMCM